MSHRFCSRVLAVLCVFMLLLTASLPALAEEEAVNLIPEKISSMDEGRVWQLYGHSGQLVYRTSLGNRFLSYRRGKWDAWLSPCFDLFPYLAPDVRRNGSGTYRLELDLIPVVRNAEKVCSFRTLLRSQSKISTVFEAFNEDNKEYRGQLAEFVSASTECWLHFSVEFCVLREDVPKSDVWNFCFDNLPGSMSGFDLDNLKLVRVSDETFSAPRNVRIIDDRPVIEREDVDVPEKVNLLPEKMSTLEGATSLKEAGWYAFAGSDIDLSAGYQGSGVKMTNMQQSWHSPAIDLLPYIKAPGTYSLSIMYKVDSPEASKGCGFLIRGKVPGDLLKQAGGNVFARLESLNAETGRWYQLCTTFNVTENDILYEDVWNLCFDGMPTGEGTSITVDNLILIKGTVKDLEDLPEIQIDDPFVTVVGRKLTHKGKLFDPSIRKEAIKTAVITVLLVAANIAFAAIVPVVQKKIRANKAQKKDLYSMP